VRSYNEQPLGNAERSVAFDVALAFGGSPYDAAGGWRKARGRRARSPYRDNRSASLLDDQPSGCWRALPAFAGM